MGDIVNLRRTRKGKSREAAASEANANRILHGTPKHRREAAKAKSAKEKHDLDSRKLDGKEPV